MTNNDISLNNLNTFALAFYAMTLKDYILFRHIINQEGITRDQLAKMTGYDERNIQSALRKLTGSPLAAKNSRYQLAKEATVAEGTGYYLTTRGREFSRYVSHGM